MFKWLRRKTKNKKGFTLVELVIAIGVMGILTVGVTAYFSSSMKQYGDSAIQIKMEDTGNQIIDRVVKEVQYAPKMILKEDFDRAKLNTRYFYIFSTGIADIDNVKPTDGKIMLVTYSETGGSTESPLMPESIYGGYYVKSLDFSIVGTGRNVLEIQMELYNKGNKKSITKKVSKVLVNFAKKIDEATGQDIALNYTYNCTSCGVDHDFKPIEIKTNANGDEVNPPYVLNAETQITNDTVYMRFGCYTEQREIFLPINEKATFKYLGFRRSA